MANIDALLSQLNSDQKEAVLENSSPLLVLAGAGSGKTRVITTKIAYCIEELGIPAYKILAVTFTNKAAKEMRERVELLLGRDPRAEDVTIRTFHSFGAWFLRRFGSAIGLGSNFTIYDDDDSLSLLASCYPNHKKRELDPVMRKISYAKDRGLGYNDNLTSLKADATFPRMFESYETKMRKVGNVDFADLIGRSIELLDASPDVLSWIHNRFQVILVDEYQDSNIAQFELLRRLVGPNCFICVVGDDDQSIYRFRGAEVQNILSFPEIYPGAKTVKLEQNYRSTQNILDIANTVIANNKGRHAKRLWTANTKGSKPTLLYVQDEADEALRVGNILLQDKNYDGSAVLYRTNAQSVAFETTLKRMRIPYKVVGALQFYDREEVKDALALLFLLTNSKDEVNFRRMVNKPPRGIGESAMETILSYSPQAEGDVFSMLELAIRSGNLSSKAKSGATQFMEMYQHANRMVDSEELVDCVNFLIRDSGLLGHYQKIDNQNSTGKVDNLEALVNALASYDSSRDGLLLFLEQLCLDPTTLGKEDPRDKAGVTLITMHNTKGLEFDRVFIAGLEEELFPGRAKESDDDIEEERRIFYVAVTRARKELYMLCAKARKIWGKTSFQHPSRFIDEIASSQIAVQGIRPGTLDALGEGGAYRGLGSLGEKRTHATKERSDGWGNSGGALIQQGFGAKAKSFTMAANHSEKEGESLYPLGQKVYSDQYGEGEVVSLKTSGDREVIDVCFVGGRKATFISKFAQLEKIGGE
ncbi:UvrD-helicase domain-containing protein [Sphaerochaeta sp. PS]|uniref:ATP-dependent helicase n=1 Tax=Sphaerochaeta sp. PS TaxID=3076336 RepID=UPI0028A4003F|nr:UvrD-helicase domain-containing protein [Sphaerochaeta sp. PS]MDT4761304.1 3'-5' exonuclease [Sphaerochaeta sp. PS]